MVDTAGSLCGAAKAIVAKGATEVSACATHGVLSGAACQRIDESPLRELTLLNTIPAPENLSEKIHYVDVSPVFAEAIQRIYEENSMASGEVQLLVCTTIIETGIDIPNVNTLIIEDADRLGLSQLHQLRGRVGRSSRHAFAYLTFRRGKVLSEIAEKRLSAIREYAEFGSGFKIAMRDLEIRGAGDLLGAEQSGHMEVGKKYFEQLIDEMKEARNVKLDTELTADDLKELAEKFKKEYREKLGEEFPQDPKIQLM